MAGVRMTVDISDLRETLLGLRQDLQEKAVMSGLRDSARLIQKRLVSASPRRTGFLHRWMRTKMVGRVRREGPSTFSVLIRRPQVFNLLESGARGHEIWPGASPRRPPSLSTQPVTPKQALRLRGEFFGRVRHPGFPARRIWGPVFEAAHEDLFQTFRMAVAKAVSRFHSRAARTR